MDIFEMVAKVLAQTPNDMKKGESVIVKCPKCGNDIKVSRSGYNGHYRFSCDNCAFYFMQ